MAFTVGTGETLTKGVTYYFRSYATNAVGTVYSANQGSFKPADVPQLVATVDLPSVTDTQAPLGGDITDDGGDTVTAVGIYWDTDGVNTRNDGIHVPMTVADPFEEIVTGLPPGSTIYFFAYATNGAGTTDSSIINFPTQAGAPTMEPTPTVANIVGDGANLGGTMASDGGGTNLDCGVELAAAPGGPYGAPQSFGVCTAGTPFAVSVSGLISGQTYYFRAYATSDAGSDYSDEDSFIPQAAPTVTSAPAANPTHNSADLGGTVVSDEGSAVTERGIVWDLNPNPEGQPTKTTVPMGSGTGAFEQTVSLPSGTTIYFEAYATNASGTAYSNDGRSVDTLTQPTVQASSLVLTPFGRSIRATWTRGNGDGSLVAVWQEPTYSMDPPSDLTDYIAQPDYSLPPPETSTGSGNFVVYKGSNNTILVTGLDLSTTYYFAVYEYAGEGTNSDYIQTSPATDFVATTDLPQHNYDYRVNCEECHKHGTQRPRQAELENKCKTCHDAGGLASTKREFKNHLLPSRNVDIDYVDCGMCHELHKQSSYNTTKSISFIDSTERVNKSFLRANVSKYVANAAEPAVLHDDVPSGHIDQPKREENNPNNDPVQPADTPQRAVEGGNDTTARGYCQVCHTLTAYHRSNEAGGATTVSAYDKNGFMQCHDGSTENAACATDVNCGDCHEHNNSFIG
ncbi:MAG: cytochrome c3 family protein, partial [Planctomycetota bacterium]